MPYIFHSVFKFPLVSPEDQHFSTFCGKSQRDGSAQPRGSTGDENLAAFKTLILSVGGLGCHKRDMADGLNLNPEGFLFDYLAGSAVSQLRTRQAWDSLFGFGPNPCIEGDAFWAGRLLRLVLENYQLLGFIGELFKRL